MPKKRKPKYFPNNWKAYKDSPDKFFIPLTYDTFYKWKVMGWALPSSIACVIREENEGKISEKIYSNKHAAKKYLDAQTSIKDTKTIFTICDDLSVQVLRPSTTIKDKYELFMDDTQDLTDEEIDELFG